MKRTVSEHAVDRYREHWPGAGEVDVEAAIVRGETVSHGTAAALAGRKEPSKHERAVTQYVVSDDRRGMFVIKAGNVVTYLRLSEQAQVIIDDPAFARALRGEANAADVQGVLNVLDKRHRRGLPWLSNHRAAALAALRVAVRGGS